MKSPISKQSYLAARIIVATANIISEGGIAAATVRAVSEKAEASPPQIYRHFGNMDGLLDAVAITLWVQHLVGAEKESDDPVNDLYRAIELLIIFGLENHGLYLHITMPRGDAVSDLWELQLEFLKARVKRVAMTGRLRVGEQQAVEFIHPFCAGMIFTTLHNTSRPTDGSWVALQAVRPLLHREQPGTDAAWEAPTLALGLAANLDDVSVLTLGERTLLKELLMRIASI